MTGPHIGLSMLYCLAEPFHKMIKRIPETKMTYIEIVDDGLHTLDKKKVSTLKDLAQSYGLTYTIHAPFAGINVALQSKPLLNSTLKRMKESIIHASALSCKMWIFHPGLKTGISMFYPGKDWTGNMESIRLLFKFAKDYGVEAAIENVTEPFVIKTAEDFKRFYKEIDEDIGLVLDTGHANINGELQDYLTEFADKIVHVHAHDNYGKTDQHLGIGFGNIDWRNAAKLLKRASYNRIVMIESVEHIDESIQRLGQLLT